MRRILLYTAGYLLAVAIGLGSIYLHGLMQRNLNAETKMMNAAVRLSGLAMWLVLIPSIALVLLCIGGALYVAFG